MSEPLGLEYLKNKVEENGYILLSKEYVNQDSPIEISDKDGFLYSPSTRTFLNNIKQGCKKLLIFHKNNKFSIYNLILWMKKNSRKSTYFSGEYSMITRRNIFLTCECGEKYNCSVNEIIRSGRDDCVTCSKKNMGMRLEKSFIVEKIKLLNFELLEDFVYENSKKTIVKIKCLKCGFCCEKKVNSLDRACSKCQKKISSEKMKMSLDTVLERLKNLNLEMLPESTYKNKDTPFLVKCLKCEYVWNRKMGSVSNKTSCPRCNQSNGENLIEKFLIKNKIIYLKQKRFSDCRNILPLPFDFYLPSFNALIEMNGEQHYFPNKFFGGNEEFEKVKMRDKIKKKFTKKNKINFLVISYKKINKIEEILINFLQNLKEEIKNETFYKRNEIC